MNVTKIKKILLAILITSILILIGMFAYDYYDMKKINANAENMIGEIDKFIENNKKLVIINGENNSNSGDGTTVNSSAANEIQELQLDGYIVYGKIKIEKIGIEYPIIEYKNSNALWKSICKISNNNVDGTGNLCLAGHNMRNLSMFGNLRKLVKGDVIKITNLYGEEYIYEVYETEYVKPSQTEVLKNTTESIVTLITCNDSSNKRLIVKGKLLL